MGNSYTALSTQDNQDILLNGGEKGGIRTSASLFMRKPPVKRPAHHKGDICCMAAQRSGIVVTGSRDKTMKLNNIDTGEVYMDWRGHDMEVTKVAYKFRNGKHFIISGSRDEKVKIWGFGHENALSTISGHSKTVSGLTVNDDGHIFSGSRDTTIRKWDSETGKQMAMNHRSRNLITHMVFNAPTKTIAQSSEDKSIKLWDERDLALIAEFPKKNNIQTFVEYLPDGMQLLSCSNGFNGDGCEISLYDVRQRKVLREFRGHEETVTSVSLLGWPSANSIQQFTQRRLILSTSHDKSVRVWNLDEGVCLWNHDGSAYHGPLFSSLCFQDGCIVVAGADGALVSMQLHARAGRPLLQTLAYTSSPSSEEY
ncbi:hypothetical protein PENTCL1PPCAC_7097 [Pristionchus entomophagus]|uniref:WD40 domain-containing protein n=1 Tax=Pristionchus entomophagus TaxID=358040 RepID=A0AAV5SQ56_9BILA|nr:hypothetical protein PENTCL1PPCAC_7097 [Pristionchus entomophagus]